MKKEKNEKKPILYEAWLNKKYQNYNQEEENDYIKIAYKATKNILLVIWYLILYGFAGIGVVTLMNDSTRYALLQLFSNIKF